MSEKHTPGPWIMSKPSSDGKWINIDAEGDGWERLECRVSSDDCDFDIAVANARLIAAAPDLFAALNRALNDLNLSCICEALDGGLCEVCQGRAAIAKAVSP